mgnify:CR=1 FL=1
MKKETGPFTANPTAGENMSGREDDNHYQGIIHRHIKFIESQCRKIIMKNYGSFSSAQNDIAIENEILELNNIVLDKLKEKNYKVLKQFKGNASISTYITAIISHKAVDLIRKKKGRGREKERAKKYGDAGERIYQMVFVDRMNISAAYSELKEKFDFDGTPEDIEAIVEKIRGKGRLDTSTPSSQGNRLIKQGVRSIETGEVIIADTGNNPEDLLMESRREKKVKEAIDKIVSQLKGEERLILRMRFPAAVDEKPQDIDRIARLLGISKKAVYNRISRTLKRCRDMLINSGVNFDDLF